MPRDPQTVHSERQRQDQPAGRKPRLGPSQGWSCRCCAGRTMNMGRICIRCLIRGNR